MEESSISWVIVARCVERLIVAISASFVCYLGYKLYALGVSQGAVEFTVKDFILKGTGPGLAFMGGGIFLLWRLLATPIKVQIPPDGGEIIVQNTAVAQGPKQK